MNIILLSGGSGKRLWPLSNDVRSKQFIKLFKNNDEYESMLQRVYRQITTVDVDAKITIATSKSQASTIKNQLGEKVSICVEPCRRDTFPAIALAAAYLHDELGIDENEAVVVCPVDPYVDSTYYETVQSLQKLVEQGDANLVLMGIEPTYPSEKYGYIIPESGENVSKVKEFKEKPDMEIAKKYLAQNALWNAGIFAFKLDYLLDKAHSMIDFVDYRDLFNKYDTLAKISFDYAVVEKESSIQVLRYSGNWRDVGTWNMMAEVMTDRTMGRVILDETCENTNVVNELNIPILCMGCKDMIIAASGDGILISDKERSGYMKPYVEKIETEAMFAEKSWGTYTVIDVQPGSMTVKVSMRAGEHMTYHMHNCREEVWTVVSGKGTLEYRSIRFENEILDQPNFQGNAAVNYTDCNTPWTRIIEHKWFEFGKDEAGNDLPKTIISREYSSEWNPGDEPYYPVNDKKNNLLYMKYKELADQNNKIIFGGRLGEYKYYDMDTTVEAALKCIAREFI